jgi:hypothetical protein
MKPGLEKRFDISAAARADQSGPNLFPLDDDQCGERFDLESLEQVGTLLAGNAIELERSVVAATLQNLRQKTLRASTRARLRRVEEN